MRVEVATAARSILRRTARVALALAGVFAIVASGGGGPFCFDVCSNGGEPLPPFVTVHPGRITVQVGATVVLTTTVINGTPVTYQWCRQPAGAPSCTPIAGATGDSFTLAGANLADDDALYTVTVSASNGSANASSLLGVSAFAPVVFHDGEFALADWTTSATATPTVGGPTHAEAQAITGGNPGAFRSVRLDMPQAPSSIRVFHGALAAVYDPATQGAIRAIDFSADCIRSSGSTADDVPTVALVLEQGGRRFAPTALTWYCASTTWDAMPMRHSIAVDEFVLVDGPACAAGESCPDFAAGAKPIRFGWLGGSELSAGATTGFITLGIDNWTVGVWRR